MKNRFFLPLFALFLTALACQSLSLPLWNLSTDSGVLLAYNTITEQQLSLQDVCIHRPEKLKEVVVIGVFAHDAGCLGNELFVGQRLGRFDNLTDEGLEANGWKNRIGRENLALLWTEQVLLAWRTPLQTATDDFQTAGVNFSPPTVQTLTDGRVQVELWVQEPVGKLPETNYSFLRVVFETDGSLGEQTVQETFTVPIGR